MCVTSAARRSPGTRSSSSSRSASPARGLRHERVRRARYTYSPPDNLPHGPTGIVIRQVGSDRRGRRYMRGKHVFGATSAGPRGHEERARQRGAGSTRGDIGDRQDGFLQDLRDRRTSSSPLAARTSRRCSRTSSRSGRRTGGGGRRSHEVRRHRDARSDASEEAAAAPQRRWQRRRAGETFKLHLQRQIDEVNLKLAASRRFEFVVVPTEFTIICGERTPTMKVAAKVEREITKAEIAAIRQHADSVRARSLSVAVSGPFAQRVLQAAN